VMIGENELEEGKLTLRNLVTGEQEKINLEACVEKLKAYFELN
jgi:histidyl-tRNA synthetase